MCSVLLLFSLYRRDLWKQNWLSKQEDEITFLCMGWDPPIVTHCTRGSFLKLQSLNVFLILKWINKISEMKKGNGEKRKNLFNIIHDDQSEVRFLSLSLSSFSSPRLISDLRYWLLLKLVTVFFFHKVEFAPWYASLACSFILIFFFLEVSCNLIWSGCIWRRNLLEVIGIWFFSFSCLFWSIKSFDF